MVSNKKLSRNFQKITFSTTLFFYRINHKPNQVMNPTNHLSKNIVITGVSTGIGYTTTKALIKKGYRVFGSVRKEADAERLRKEFGGNFEPLLFDVTQHDAVKKEAARVAQLVGDEGIAVLFNNAGIGIAGPMMHFPIEELRRIIEVNVIGLFATTQAFLPLLGAKKNCPHPPGRIINSSSIAGKFAHPFAGGYSATKHAVEGLSGSMRMELQLYGIDVIVLNSGVVKTPIWEKEDFDPEPYADTDYYESAKKVKKHMFDMADKGYEQDEFGEMLLKIIETKHPKTRYPLVYSKWENWILPKILPTKIINKIIGKRLGFLKK